MTPVGMEKRDPSHVASCQPAASVTIPVNQPFKITDELGGAGILASGSSLACAGKAV